MACVAFLETKSWSQQEKRVATVLDRNEKIFKEWATSLRMSTDVSKTKPKSRRTAYLSQAMLAKENKLMSKYKMSQYQLFVILGQRVAEEWPTEKSTDINIVKPIIAQCQANLDSFMFDKDMYECIYAHASRPPIRSFSATYSLTGFSARFSRAFSMGRRQTRHCRRSGMNCDETPLFTLVGRQSTVPNANVRLSANPAAYVTRTEIDLPPSGVKRNRSIARNCPSTMTHRPGTSTPWTRSSHTASPFPVLPTSVVKPIGIGLSSVSRTRSSWGTGGNGRTRNGWRW